MDARLPDDVPAWAPGGWLRRTVTCLSRVSLATVIGSVACLGFYALQFLIEGIDPLDRWFYFWLSVKFGGVIGFVVGLFWGLPKLLPVPPVSAK